MTAAELVETVGLTAAVRGKVVMEGDLASIGMVADVQQPPQGHQYFSFEMIRTE